MIDIYTLQTPCERYAEEQEWNRKVYLCEVVVYNLVQKGLIPMQEYLNLSNNLEDIFDTQIIRVIEKYCDRETLDNL